MALAGPLRPSRAAVATLVASDGRHRVLGRGNASHPGAVPLEQSADRLLRRGGAQHVGHKLRSEVLLLEALAERLYELRRELSLCGSKMTRINARRAIQAAGAASNGTLSTGSIGRHATLLDAWRLHEELDRLVWRQPEQCVRQLGCHARLLPQLQSDVPSLGLREALILQLRDRLVRIHREQPFAKLRRELDRAAAATHDSHVGDGAFEAREVRLGGNTVPLRAGCGAVTLPRKSARTRSHRQGGTCADSAYMHRISGLLRY